MLSLASKNAIKFPIIGYLVTIERENDSFIQYVVYLY